MKIVVAALAIVSLSQVPACAAEEEADNVPGRANYDCHLYTGNSVGPDKGVVQADLTYLEDGRRLRYRVEYRVDDFTLTWEARGWSEQGRTIDWQQGQVTMSRSLIAAVIRPRKDEQWSQVLIDRDHSLKVVESEGDRYLLPDLFGMTLMGEPGTLTSPIRARISIANLAAWHANAGTLTVYETLVGVRRPKRGHSYASPYGLRRILASYDVDLGKITQALADTRSTVDEWEKSLSNFQETCGKRIEEDEAQIVVT